MTFRLRLFLLVMLVAIVSVAATTWLTFSLASRQTAAATARANRNVTDISAALRRYAHDHGTWSGVSDRAAALSTGYQQRIRLVTLDGTVLVDSDQLAGRVDRPVISPATLVNPRPQLALQPASDVYRLKTLNPVKTVANELSGYRLTVTLTRCAAEHNYADPIRVTDDALGIPQADLDTADPADPCVKEHVAPADAAADLAAVTACFHVGAAAQPSCLEQAFAERVDTFAPPPIQMFLGGLDDASPVIDRATLSAAGAVLAIAVIGTALIARRVSRPIRALTTASTRLADGQLDTRVPFGGGDEVGQLARSFNRMADALQQAEQDQRGLVASVAHELRTPMSNLRGYLEALQDGVLAPSPQLFASLHEEVLLQRRILDDLQDLTLAEAGDLAYRRQSVDLAELVEISRIAHRAVAKQAGVDLRADVAGPLPIVGDQDRLRQVLGNLITNALRYTDAGGTVLLHAFAQNGFGVVEVHDTGCGIATANLRYVFQRFWRADPARDRRTGGSGLGLTIALQIATDHGGSIEVGSELGVGSTFTLRIPLRPT